MKLLPSDTGAERAILGIMLLGGDGVMEILPECSPTLFSDVRNQFIFKAIRSLFLNNRGINLITARDELRRQKTLEEAGGVDYLAALSDGVPHGYKARDEIRILKDLAERRECIRLAAKVQKEAYDLAQECVPQRASENFQSIGRRSDENIKPCQEVLSSTVTAMEGIQKSGETFTGITTGLGFLDRFHGGFPRSALTIIAARPSIGKSSFCINAAVRAALKEKTIAFFTLEDTNTSLAKRILCFLARVDGMRIMRGELKPMEWQKLIEAKNEVMKTKMFFNDAPQKIEEICNGARRIKHEHGLDVLVVDYLQLILGEIRESRNVQIAQWTRSLKMLAQELDIALLLVSQLNRAPEAAGRRPRLSDLRESGAIEQDADLVLMLHRKFEKEKDLHVTEPRHVELLVAKNRNGPTGIFSERLNFTPAYTLFFESPS